MALPEYSKPVTLNDREIEGMELNERTQWNEMYKEKLTNKHNLLVLKQKNEIEAMKTRLEKSINSKLKQRMKAYDKLLQSIENMQNQVINKQNRQFSKVQAVNARVLAKNSLNLVDLEQKAFGRICVIERTEVITNSEEDRKGKILTRSSAPLPEHLSQLQIRTPPNA